MAARLSALAWAALFAVRARAFLSSCSHTPPLLDMPCFKSSEKPRKRQPVHQLRSMTNGVLGTRVPGASWRGSLVAKACSQVTTPPDLALGAGVERMFERPQRWDTALVRPSTAVGRDSGFHQFHRHWGQLRSIGTGLKSACLTARSERQYENLGT